MDAVTTDDLKAEVIRRVQSRDDRWNIDPGTALVPGASVADDATLEQMTQGLANGVPPAALQGFRIAQVTEDSISISAPLEHTWNGAGIGFAGSLATLVAFTGASMAGQAVRSRLRPHLPRKSQNLPQHPLLRAARRLTSSSR